MADAGSAERWTLSASGTDSGKVVLVLFGWVFVLMIVVAVRDGMPPVFALLIAASLVSAGWISLRLKVVETDGQRLFVSTYFKTMSLPLTLVESVRSGWWPFPVHRVVTVEFREETTLGRRIAFRPRASLKALWTGQGVVEELRALVARANSGRPIGPEDLRAHPRPESS